MTIRRTLLSGIWHVGIEAPLYPFLLAIQPLTNLYFTNLRTLAVSFIIPPLLAIEGFTALAFVFFLIATRSRSRAAVLSAIIVVATLDYGEFYAVIQSLLSQLAIPISHQYVFPAWIGVWTILLIVCLRTPRLSVGLGTLLNVISIAMLTVVVLPGMAQLGQDLLGPYRVPTGQGPQGRGTGGHVELVELPDVYYIILDGYGRADVLEDLLGFDNSGFVVAMSDLGFYVAGESRSNYSQTLHSLSSSLNMVYHPGSLTPGSAGEFSESIMGLISQIQDNRVMREFRSMGYKIINLASGFEATDTITLADENVHSTLFNQVNSEVIETTLLRPVSGLMAAIGRRENVLGAFDSLRQVASSPDHTFVLAHILIPHPPYVFDRAGNIPSVIALDDTLVSSWLPSEGYGDQVAFVNSLVLATVEAVLAQSDTPPIIIIQGDHGPESDWMRPRERMPILNAYYLPGGGSEFLYPSISPVNTFRLVLDLYFGRHYGLVPDVAVFSTYADAGVYCVDDEAYAGEADPETLAAAQRRILEDSSLRIDVAASACDLEKFLPINSGFYDLEFNGGRLFRWAQAEARIDVPVDSGQVYELSLGVTQAFSDEPTHLRVFVGGKSAGTAVVAPGFNVLRFAIPPSLIGSSPIARLDFVSDLLREDLGPRQLSLRYHWFSWMSVAEAARMAGSRAGPKFAPLVRLDSRLDGEVGIEPDLQSPWNIETNEGRSWLWLGGSGTPPLGMTIHSASSRTVFLIVDVAPGPSRDDTLRTLLVTISNSGGSVRIQEAFSSPGTIRMRVGLEPGRNYVTLECLEAATTPIVPNGDARPLLVKLESVFISE